MMYRNRRVDRIVLGGRVIYDDSEDFATVFRRKMFARQFVMENGNTKEAYRKTFGVANVNHENLSDLMNNINTQKEIERFLPTEEELARVLRAGLMAKTPAEIDWSTKHAYLQTGLKLRGHLLQKEESAATQVNIAMVIKE